MTQHKRSIERRIGVCYAIRARCRRQLGDLAGSVADSSRALALDPDMTDAYAIRARAPKQLGDLSGSMDDVIDAAKLNAGSLDDYSTSKPTRSHRQFGVGRAANAARHPMTG